MTRKKQVLSVLWLMTSLVVCAGAQSKSITQGPHRIELTLERRTALGWKVMDPGYIFAKNDQVRFRYKTNFAGALYVMNQGTGGAYTKLFPREDTGMANRITPGKEYLVPATDGAFRVEGPAGHDVIYWVIQPVDNYEPLAAPPANMAKAMATLTPRCDDTVLRAKGDCVDSSAGPQAVGDKAQLPENIQKSAGDTSKDLVFMKKQGRSVVSSPVPLAGPVVFEFRLAHK